tara:strand:- start:1302 stop:1487 length:186 start_codon:yes stop_codon:yes gene_type:complete
MKSKNHVLDSSKAIRGLERREHFAAGGTLEAWRGRSGFTIDRKKKNSKSKCRGRVQWNMER